MAPEVTSPEAPAIELPRLSVAPTVAAGDGVAVPPGVSELPAVPVPGMTGTGATLRGREGTPLLAPVPASGQVALVSNAAGRHLTVSVDWGDGSAPSKGEASATSEQSFQVTASHVYEREGTYKVTVMITDTAGASLVVLSRAEVAEPPDALNNALDAVIDG